MNRRPPSSHRPATLFPSTPLFRSLTSDSPNRLAQASFSRANCGATTGYSDEVRVSRGKNAAVSGDTVLRFDDNHATEWPNNDRDVIGFSWSDDSQIGRAHV